MKKKNFLVILLILLALGIWSHNAYRIFIGVTRADDELFLPEPHAHWMNDDSLVSSSRQPPAFIYEARYRDPFQHELLPEAKKIAPRQHLPKIEKPKSVPPALRFGGLVRDVNAVLAVIEGPNGEVHFAKENDMIAGIKLVKIDSSHVICEFGKQRYALALQ